MVISIKNIYMLFLCQFFSLLLLLSSCWLSMLILLLTEAEVAKKDVSTKYQLFDSILSE